MNWTNLHEFPNPDVERTWRECLERADFATHYVSPEYFREPFFRDKKPFAVLGWQDDKVVGVVTGLHESGQVVCGQMSRPQFCFDESIDPASVAEQLAEGLQAEAGSETLITLYTMSQLDALLASGYRCEMQEGVVVLDLTSGAEALFKGFASTRRTDIRNAIKRGVEVGIANTREEFQTYYEIYVGWCERKKIAPSSFEVLEEALFLTDSRRLFLARFDSKIIAGTVIRLCPGGMIEYAANSSEPESLKLRPNDLLQWRVVEWACEQGYERYSLGGAHLFSRRMGGTILPVYRYRLDRSWMRRHELSEALGQSGRKVFNALPAGLRNQVRRVLKRAD